MQTTYLILGVYYKDNPQPVGRRYSSPSHIMVMRFDPNGNMFHFHSSLPASGAVDIECFTSGQRTYLVVANYCNDNGRLDIFSYIYLYNEQFRGFQLHQYISTHGARDVEHFKLANEDYIVIANEAYGTLTNKTFGSHSTVYKISHGKFEQVQSLETYGAIKWKHLSVPNCKQDVLLMYGDQRNNIDQVGIYSFSHDQESFKAVQFSIYHTDDLSPSYRPHPLSLAAFNTQDLQTGDYSLYVIIGANDTTSKSNVYKLSYDIIYTDSPLDAFGRDVQDQIAALNNTINEVRRLLANAKETLADAVTKEGEQLITGKKNFESLTFLTGTINTVNLTVGSLLLVKDNKTYRAHPSIVPHVPLKELEENVTRHNNTVRGVLDNEENLMYIDVSQNVTAPLHFTSIRGDDVDAQNVNLISDVINDVNVTHLMHDVIVKNVDTVVGKKTFAGGVNVYANMTVNGLINNISTSDVVVNGTNQTILALKVFTENVMVMGNLTSGSINEFDFNKAIQINQPTTITGPVTFNNDISTTNITAHRTINMVTLSELFSNTVSKSVKQNITGHKLFTNVLSNKNVKVGLVSGLDLSKLAEEAAKVSNSSYIYGNKIFTNNVTILEDLHVEELINEIKFPKDLVFESKQQNITGKKVFTGNVAMSQNIGTTGTVDGINLDSVVTLSTRQTIVGQKTLTNTVSFEGDVFVQENRTVNKIDISEFVKYIVTSSGNQVFPSLTFSDHITFYQSKIANLINNDTVASMNELFVNSLHSAGNQTFTGEKVFTSQINITKDLQADTINNLSFPVYFARVNANQTFTANKTFVDDVYLTELETDETINGIDIANFSASIITTDGNDIIKGKKNFSGNVTIHGNLYIAGSMNNIKLATDLMFIGLDQVVAGKKFFSTMIFPNLHVTAMKNIGVETTIDRVDLSELDLSGMTVTRNETVTGKMCFEQTDYNRSVDYINGIDLSALKADIVTLETEQTITSEKYFEILKLERNLNTTSTIDGIDVSDLYAAAILTNRDGSVVGNVTFHNNITIVNDLTTGLMDSVNISKFSELFISKSQNETLGNLTINDSVQATTVTVEKVNNINIAKDVVFKDVDQIIHDSKQFGNVSIVNMSTSGLINGVNFTALQNEAVFIDSNATLSGANTFANNVSVNGNITTTGTVNGYDLQNLNVARTSGLVDLLLTKILALVFLYINRSSFLAFHLKS